MAGPSDAARRDLFPELAQLQREAAALASTLRAAQAATEQTSGRDPSEQVRVVLTPTGRIGSVEVAPGWPARLAAAGLGQAVLAAYREACGRRLETWATEISRAKDGDPDDVPAPISPAQVTNGPSDKTAHDGMRQLFYLLQDATDQLDDVVREAADRSTAVVTGSDPAGHVTATFVGGDLTGVEVDEHWSTGATGREIGAGVTDAITHGYAAVDRLAESSPITRWPFADLERLSGDPAALLAGLGFPGPDTEGD